MDLKKLALRIAGTVFGVVAILHLLRIITGVSVQIGGYEFPVWINWLGLAGATLLCFWLWRVSVQDDR